MFRLKLECDIDKVTDTAANMNSFRREIEEQWNTKYPRHVQSADHILQLTVVIASGNVAVENYSEETSVGYFKKACK